MSGSMKLLSISKDIDELSLFEKLFLLDRIWKDLEVAMDGLLITCVSNEHIMADVMEASEEEHEKDEALEDVHLKEETPSNVIFITRKKL